MGFRLHVLGAGSILPRQGYGCAGYALCVDGSHEVTLLDRWGGNRPLPRMPKAEVADAILSHALTLRATQPRRVAR